MEANANPKPVTLLLNEEEIKDIVYMDLLEKSPEGASILKEIWGKDFSMGGKIILLRGYPFLCPFLTFFALPSMICRY